MFSFCYFWWIKILQNRMDGDKVFCIFCLVQVFSLTDKLLVKMPALYWSVWGWAGVLWLQLPPCGPWKVLTMSNWFSVIHLKKSRLNSFSYWKICLTIIHWFTAWITMTARCHLVWNQEAGTPSSSPTWIVRTQLLELCSTAFLDALAKS